MFLGSRSLLTIRRNTIKLETCTYPCISRCNFWEQSRESNCFLTTCRRKEATNYWLQDNLVFLLLTIWSNTIKLDSKNVLTRVFLSAICVKSIQSKQRFSQHLPKKWSNEWLGCNITLCFFSLQSEAIQDCKVRKQKHNIFYTRPYFTCFHHNLWEELK